MSWKIEVIADNTGKWTTNAVRLPDEEQAKAYGFDLAMRWTSIQDWRAIECDDIVTADWSMTVGLIHRY